MILHEKKLIMQYIYSNSFLFPNLLIGILKNMLLWLIKNYSTLFRLRNSVREKYN